MGTQKKEGPTGGSTFMWDPLRRYKERIPFEVGLEDKQASEW